MGQTAGYCEAFGAWMFQRADTAERVKVSIGQP